MSLRTEMHAAFDEIAPSTQGIPARVIETVLYDGPGRRRREGMMFRLRAPLSLAAVLLLVALVAAALVGGRLARDWNFVHNPNPAGQSYDTQVAQLEAVPLNIPVVATATECRSGPYNSKGSYGSGPVYGDGGAVSTTSWGLYFHNLAYAETNIQGPILVRAIDLFTRQPVIFVGQYAAGPVVGHDTVDGVAVEQHPAFVFDTSNASKLPATHKYTWSFIAGVPGTWSGSTGWQIDGVGFSEVFVAC